VENMEYKPGYSLIKYGHILTLNFNKEFSERFYHVLADYLKINPANKEVALFAQQLQGLMGNESVKVRESQWVMTRLEHVYAVTFQKDIAQNINAIFTEFLTVHRVSPALFSFAKQLASYVFPKRFSEGFADDPEN
jgi:hypothetical protein